jgi:hypothetical protein
MKYELDWTRYYSDNGFHTLIAILTGLPIEEIVAACPDRDRWHGRDFRETLNKLGFNTNVRFKKFDPETSYPCIMRFKLRGKSEQGTWYCFAYYDGEVQMGNSSCSLKEWEQMYRRYRITSMLQVWI